MSPLVILLAFAAYVLPVVAQDGACTNPGRCEPEDTPVTMLQTATKTKKGADRTVTAEASAQGCAHLTNRGPYFSVAVSAGTPAQTFDLVADTGSNALTLPDCECAFNGGGCSGVKNCFLSKASKTLGWSLHWGNKSVGVNGRILGYGSGQILTAIASDMVTVGGIQTFMKDGIYLIENREFLQGGPNFQGILGLGIPSEAYRTPMFSVESLTSDYTMCFTHKYGALRMDTPAIPNPMTNIGTIHWGLDFQGMSLGDDHVKLPFCDPHTIKPPQETACGAIPDSGTTLMLGPAAQIRAMFTAICEKWPRCTKFAKEKTVQLDTAFHHMVTTCNTWMHHGKGIDEVPSIFLHVAGKEGKPQKVELPARRYIAETTMTLMAKVTEEIFGFIPVTEMIPLESRKVCQAMFGASPMHNPIHGPVWIFGTPLFYSATVGYSLDNGGKISIENKPCTACGSATSEVDNDLRHLEDLRHSNYDLQEPF